jgi:flagellar biosynthesis protein
MAKPKTDEAKAVALRYNKHKENAPRILAKGRGELARRILDKAQEHGISVYHDQDLVEVLSALELDTEIPGELYKAVAEVMVFVYKLNGRKL